MDNLRIVLLAALITVVLFGGAGLVRHGSFWGAATQVRGELTQRLGTKGPAVAVTSMPEPVPRNEPVRIFGLRVKEAFAMPSGADRMTRLSGAREELKTRLMQGP